MLSSVFLPPLSLMLPLPSVILGAPDTLWPPGKTHKWKKIEARKKTKKRHQKNCKKNRKKENNNQSDKQKITRFV